MKVKLPIQTKEIVDNKLVKKTSEQIFDVDTSLASQMRFESKFPKLAEREDLYGYSRRIFEIEDLTAPVIISKMKMLYCWFDTEISFVEFVKLFDLSEPKYVKELTNAMKTIFELIFEESAEKN